MNISGIVVIATPEHFETVLDGLERSTLAEVHFNDGEKTIIVTIEGENVGVETEKLREIQTMDHVLSAEMSYSYSEEELDKLREDVELSRGEVPEFLNNEDARAEVISIGTLAQSQKSERLF